METTLITKVRRPRNGEARFSKLVCGCESKTKEAMSYLGRCGIEYLPLSKAVEQWGCSESGGYVSELTDEKQNLFYDTDEELGFVRECGDLGLWEALVEIGVPEDKADDIADIICAGRTDDAVDALAKEGLVGQYVDYQGYPAVAYGVFLL